MSPVTATRISFDDAIAEALQMEMHRDPAIVSFFCSPDGVAARVADAFGDERAVHTAEVGAPLLLAACGAAQEGMRPVCELGLDDTDAGTLDQLAELAAVASSTRTSTPIAVRLAVGNQSPAAGSGADPLGLLLGRPGLKVVEPSTAADVKGLIVAAMRDDDPVCVLEHVALRTRVEAVPEGAHVVEIGRARLATDGERLTVVAHGTAVAPALRAIESNQLDADLLDLRTLQPLDADAVLTSVRKTGRLLIVEAWGEGGRVTSELIGAIWERAFEHLDASPRRLRLGGPELNGGTPTSDVERIGAECDELLSY